LVNSLGLSDPQRDLQDYNKINILEFVATAKR